MAEPLARSQAAIELFNSEEAANNTTSPLYLHLLRGSQGPYLQALPLNRLNHYLRLAGYGPAVMKQIVEYLYVNREALFPDPLNHHYLKTRLAQKILSYSGKYYSRLRSETHEIFAALHEHLHSFEEHLVRAVTQKDQAQLQILIEKANTPDKNLLIINHLKNNIALFELLDETLLKPIEKKSVLALEEVESENESEGPSLKPINEWLPSPLNFSQNQELHLGLISTLCELACDNLNTSYPSAAAADKIIALLIYPAHTSDLHEIVKTLQQHPKAASAVWDALFCQLGILNPSNISEEHTAKLNAILNAFFISYTPDKSKRAPGNLPGLAEIIKGINDRDRDNGLKRFFGALTKEAKQKGCRSDLQNNTLSQYIDDDHLYEKVESLLLE